MSRYISAIDLGTTKIATLIGEEREGSVRVIAYSEAPSAGIIRGEVVNIQKVLDAMAPTIQSVESQSGIEIKDVFVGITGHNIRCESIQEKKNRNNSSDLISVEEIDQMVKDIYSSRVNIGEQVIDVIPQFYNIDDYMGITDPIGMPGKQIEAHYIAFIGKTSSAANCRSTINRSGLNLNNLILEPIASATAILNEEEMEVGVAMVDIGGGTTDLVIVKDNVIRHTAVIPFGGNSITEDIRQVCGVSLKHAEQMKTQYGSCYSEYVSSDKSISIEGIGGRGSKEVTFKLLANIIEARVTEIFEAVLYEIEKSTFGNQIPIGIVITGGSSQLANITQLSKYVTGYDSKIAYPMLSITSDSCEEVYSPSASTVVGVALCGLKGLSKESVANETTPAQDKLFPEEELEALKQAKDKTKSKPKNNKYGLNMFKNLFDSSNNEA